VRLDVEHEIVPKIAKHYELAFSMWKDSKVRGGTHGNPAGLAHLWAL
jgi:hypothetical protein